MTGLVHPPTDDLTGASALRPLDFSNLLAYHHDPVLPSASISPAVWPVNTLSPLCSARSRLAAPASSIPLSSVSADPAASFSSLALGHDVANWFAPLSPLFKSSPRVASTQMTDAFPSVAREPPVNSMVTGETTTASTAVWGAAAVHSSTAPNISENGAMPIDLSSIPPSNAFTADNLDMVQPLKQPVVQSIQPAAETAQTISPYAHSTGTSTSPASKTAPSVMPEIAKAKSGGKSAMTRKVSQTMSSLDKAAERRRKNRESSSRCYYNRKRIIETLDKQISQEKSKLTALYDRALELRHENARLKKDVVTNGIALPTKARGVPCYRSDSAFQLQGYLQLLQSASYRGRE